MKLNRGKYKNIETGFIGRKPEIKMNLPKPINIFTRLFIRAVNYADQIFLP